MLPSAVWQYLAQYTAIAQNPFAIGTVNETSNHVAFSSKWQILGPFQIGTREIAWGADPLELHGGFHNLVYDETAKFHSSLAFNSTVKWSSVTAELAHASNGTAEARVQVEFPNIEWTFLQQVYGWAALQWQAWTRGHIDVAGEHDIRVHLSTDSIVEYWIDGEHHFGGDFYGARSAPLVLQLSPGRHQVDIRIFRDVRAFGGIDNPTVDISLKLSRAAKPRPVTVGHVVMPDATDDCTGPWLAQLASAQVRNDAEETITIRSIEDFSGSCRADLISNSPIKIAPGQTRPLAFRFSCERASTTRYNLGFRYVAEETDVARTVHFRGRRRIVEHGHDPIKITFMHPSGIVSYAILRPPSHKASELCPDTRMMPILVALHGAGVDADSDMSRHSLDGLPDLCAWTLLPSGVTAWSSDDWHTWGFLDVDAAVSTMPDIVEQLGWTGAEPDTTRWVVTGHSNGGQGAWYALTHRQDRIIAAAPISGYSSIQNYVPYSLHRIGDPSREAILQGGLLDYRHELLLENAHGIALYQQHGSKDDNVPAFHSRLLRQRLEQVDIDSTYFEIPGVPHWWDDIFATPSLSKFLTEHIHTPRKGTVETLIPTNRFSLVVANPGSASLKYGFEIMQIVTPGRLARLDVTFDITTDTCTCLPSNVLQFRIPMPCQIVFINDQAIELAEAEHDGSRTLVLTPTGWTPSVIAAKALPDFPQWRRPSQQGGLEAILRSKGAFQIVQHSTSSPRANKIALQISRNFVTYYGADSAITTDYRSALSNRMGNVISVAIGDDLPPAFRPNLPIEIIGSKLILKSGLSKYVYAAKDDGLAAIWVRPPQQFGDKLELVVWGVDEESLEVAARLVPMLTGTGQPDFVVLDRKMLWKGVDGVLAMGYFDFNWAVTSNSYL